ncbi:MAG: hydrogenase 4 subunit B [Acidobacteriia bacterium]|nr:hydrogenase 4 subunit B [Methyloceanibacter sp.]MCL6491188.1 hydrogenase 4 subunit B [Terriglobia bacterium]
MSHELLAIALAAWLIAAVLGLIGHAPRVARALLGLGGVAMIVLALAVLPGSVPPLWTPLGIGPAGAIFRLPPDALWLMGFGFAAAVFASWLGTPSSRQGAWIFGAAASLIGALGVFGLQDAVSFLAAWEMMSLGGGVMILGEDLGSEKGRPVLFMLALLEAGTVALILAFILLAKHAGSLSFADFAAGAQTMPHAEQLFVGLLLLIGFGAKLGLLPFYEWFPGAYGAASGATGALLSGIVLNAAFFALSRGLIDWLPADHTSPVSVPGIFVVAVAVLSAILTALYAFQQEAWRELLSLSSAENGSIAICLLGAALMFRQDGLTNLAGLAWTVALLHLAGHALAKGSMFLAADGVYRAAGDYRLVQRGILRRSSWFYGVGALFGAMSLAAMPPQAGFVSEWYLFQTFFQGFHLSALASRLTAALAGAGLALTVAVAFATFLKVFGIGLLGRADRRDKAVPVANALGVGILGLLVLVLAVGMPAWLSALGPVVAQKFATATVPDMHVGLLLVPATGAPIRLNGTFAFISPTLLVVVMPLLALIPLTLLFATRRFAVRLAPVWYGGRDQDPARAATTALTFSNALRTFYSFIYRPTVETEHELAHEANGQRYFIRRLVFTHDVAPIFGPYLFAPLEKLVMAIAGRLRMIQSGHLNFYLALIGALLVIILFIAIL